MRQIQKQLGEDESSSEELAELKEALDKAGLPEEALEQAKKELKRLERMPDASGETPPSGWWTGRPFRSVVSAT